MGTTFIPVALGKLIFTLSRLFKIGGGFAAPGLYALKIDPDIVGKLTSEIPVQILITGTNGKTTTSGMLAHLYEKSGVKVLRNKTGSNLERGIASTLIKHCPLFGKVREGVAVWEVDEAAFNTLAPKIKPDLIVFLNVYRDQLDRYGEVDSIVSKWVQTVNKLPSSTKLLINADDGNLERFLDSGKQIEAFSVPGTGFKGEKETERKINARFSGLNAKSSLQESNFIFEYGKEKLPVKLTIAGTYNIDNAVAALSSKFLTAGLTEADAKNLERFGSAFGRSERFVLNNKEGYIFLIKNPAGATQVMETVMPNLKTGDTLILALNDNFADGTDVSWIWDIDLEKFEVSDSKYRIRVTGTRAYDLALRLKYAGVPEKKIEMAPSMETALEETGKEGRIFVLPTYTAMLNLQKILVKKGIKKEYWKNG